MCERETERYPSGCGGLCLCTCPCPCRCRLSIVVVVPKRIEFKFNDNAHSVVTIYNKAVHAQNLTCTRPSPFCPLFIYSPLHCSPSQPPSVPSSSIHSCTSYRIVRKSFRFSCSFVIIQWPGCIDIANEEKKAKENRCVVAAQGRTTDNINSN